MSEPRVLQIGRNFRDVVRIAYVLRHGTGYNEYASLGLFSLCSTDNLK